MSRITWEPSKRQYGSGEEGKLDKYIIFELFYDGSRPKSKEVPPYKLVCLLPGIKEHLGHYNQKEGKEFAERVLEHWLKNAGLIKKEN